MDIKSLTELSSALAWPLVLLVLIVVFRKELKSIAGNTPALFRRAREIKVGPLELALEKQAMTAGHPEIVSALKGISSTSLKEFLRLRGRSEWSGLVSHGSDRYDVEYYSSPGNSKLQCLAELEKRELLRFNNLTLEDFVAFFKGLEHTIEMPDQSIRVNASVLAPADLDKVTDQMYEVTQLGETARQIIFDTIARELAEK